tara:strand:+ start:210 stop:965 length:756 start_codon:yes stop_codon:yes gene_type:complete
MRILITGGKGYIATSLSKKLNNTVLITRKDFDLTNREATNKWFKNKFFDVIIHTAICGGSRLKKDNNSVLANNLKMFYNLIANQDKFNQLINLGSGAELHNPFDSYGLSKAIIWETIKNNPKLNNVRVFGVFDENELNTRFIKTCINNYKAKNPLIIHQNKLFDFIYMDDLVTIINFIISNPNIKVIDCCYHKNYSLKEIADYINGLNNHYCEVKVNNNKLGKPYIGKFKKYNLDLIGLKQGINRTYDKIN